VNERDLLRYLLDAIEAEQVPYFVVGSLASSYYGEPRFTLDIDVAVWLGSDADRVTAFCDRFSSPDFYVSVEAARRAVEEGGQFHIIHPESAFKIDLMILQNSVYDRKRRERVRKVIFPDVGELYIAAPEDVILKKMQYCQEGGSEKHLRDIASMIRIRRDEIDLDDIAGWALKLGVDEVWRSIQDKLQG
jgi:hypothetical protein